VISSYCNFICILCAIYFRGLDNLSLTRELYEMILLDSQLIPDTLASPDDESGVLLKRLYRATKKIVQNLISYVL